MYDMHVAPIIILHNISHFFFFLSCSLLDLLPWLALLSCWKIHFRFNFNFQTDSFPIFSSTLWHDPEFITDSVAASWPVPRVAKPPQTVSFSPPCFTVLHPKSSYIFLLIHLSWACYLPSRANCIFCWTAKAVSWYTPHAGHIYETGFWQQ